MVTAIVFLESVGARGTRITERRAGRRRVGEGAEGVRTRLLDAVRSKRKEFFHASEFLVGVCCLRCCEATITPGPRRRDGG